MKEWLRHHWKRVVLIAAGILLVGTAGYVYWRADAAMRGVAKSGTAADLMHPQALNGEQSGRVNILIAGNSSDDAGHDGADLTDSIIVASYETSTKKLTLISVPRDLYVQSSDGGYMKINAIYNVDNQMEGLKAVVEQVTGLTINHQVLVNYEAFRKMIDAVGGIDLTIKTDDPRGIYDPMIGFKISNGTHHMNGKDALLLARCRNDPTYDGREAYGLPGGDFDRTANQRHIMEALLKKINSSDTVVNPGTLQSLIDSLAGNVSSDFTVGQLRRLYDIGKDISSTKSISLRGDDDNVLLASYMTADAGDTLIPAGGIGAYGPIQEYLRAQLGLSATTGASTGNTDQ